MDHSLVAPRAVVLHPILGSKRVVAADLRSPEAYLQEANGLARAIDLDVREAKLVPVSAPRAGTLFGTGKVEELGALARACEAEVVIIDGPLTPIQQRNLEKAWNAKVIDRTGLILEIFAERAKSSEGRLQVELARLQYQRSRLVRSWTHLERQRGGLGKTGGPGETQIESDRRMIRERIARIERRLDEVRRGRSLQRSGRKKVPVPIVALVGYTNAGKSTLFNRLAAAEVMAADMLFATLDPTMRAVALQSGRKIVLSDTVGFISRLPTELVAAFRATLEEVLQADIILHVRDAASPASAAERMDVIGVLKDMGVSEGDPRVVEVLTKVDLLETDTRTALGLQCGAGAIAVSALTGEGLDRLLNRLDEILGATSESFTILIPPNAPSAAAWLHAHADVRSVTSVDDGGQIITVMIDDNGLGQFRKRFGNATKIDRGETKLVIANGF